MVFYKNPLLTPGKWQKWMVLEINEIMKKIAPRKIAFRPPRGEARKIQ